MRFKITATNGSYPAFSSDYKCRLEEYASRLGLESYVCDVGDWQPYFYHEINTIEELKYMCDILEVSEYIISFGIEPEIEIYDGYRE